MSKTLTCGRFQLSLKRPLIMAIINVTPDSFSGDGLSANLDAARVQAERAIAEGADILDIGGESTRPGADPVPVEEELARVVPLVEALTGLDVPLSVDTCKPEVMKAAIAVGADMINDIMALRAPGAVEAVAGSRAAVCLMHMQGEPRTMQHQPHYTDVVGEVSAFLRERTEVAIAAGIGAERIVLDAGFGFGKTLEHNLALLRNFRAFREAGLPLLAGMSRKSMLGALTGRPVLERAVASAVAASLAVERGAQIVRVHDVSATRDALAVCSALL